MDEMASAPDMDSSLPAIASIRASVLALLVQHMDQRSGKTDLLLAAHGLMRSQLADPYAKVPMARYVALFEEAAILAEEPALGARMGLMFKPGDIGPIGVLFSLTSTISGALERLSRYVISVQTATGSGVFEENGDLVWSYRLLDPSLWPRRQESEFTLSASCQLIRSCFGRNWRPLEVHFEHQAPRDTSVLKRIFRAPLLFGQSGNRLVLARADADKVHRIEDDSLTGILERHIADLIGNEAQQEGGVTQKVRTLISIYLGHKPVTINTVASDLNISPRSLQRRLANEGTSLRVLVRDHRQALAALHLENRDANMAQIADALGYADATVLWRARRNWQRHLEVRPANDD
jgi:AraC-like DNA-binding protein